MAWKRGTQNNIPGEIRKGHIREFLTPSSKACSVSTAIRIIDSPEEGFLHSTAAAVSRVPDEFLPHLIDGVLYIHSHDHPRTVLRVEINEKIPEKCIALNETQRINSKVCIGELQQWTVYQGDFYAYDGREGAIGDTAVRKSSKPPSILQRVIINLRPKEAVSTDIQIHGCHPDNDEKNIEKIDSLLIIKSFAVLLYGCIISNDDIYTTVVRSGIGSDVCIVGRIAEVLPMPLTPGPGLGLGLGSSEEDDEDSSADTYRGIIGIETEFFLNLENPTIPWELINSPQPPLVSQAS